MKRSSKIADRLVCVCEKETLGAIVIGSLSIKCRFKTYRKEEGNLIEKDHNRLLGLFSNGSFCLAFDTSKEGFIVRLEEKRGCIALY